MSQPTRRLAVPALALVLGAVALLTLVRAQAGDAPAGSTAPAAMVGGGFVGSWVLHSLDPGTGALVNTALITFHADGTVVASDAAEPNGPDTISAYQGAWRATDADTAAFSVQARTAHREKGATSRGSLRGNATLELGAGGGTFTGKEEVSFFDPGGRLVFTGSVRQKGFRVQVQAAQGGR